MYHEYEWYHEWMSTKLNTMINSTEFMERESEGIGQNMSKLDAPHTGWFTCQKPVVAAKSPMFMPEHVWEIMSQHDAGSACSFGVCITY